MSKSYNSYPRDHVYHPESVNGERNNYLFNNPLYPSHDPDGKIRDSIYWVLSANRKVDDAERQLLRNQLNSQFDDLYTRILSRESGRATFVHQGAMLGMQAGGGSILFHTKTRHFLMHRVAVTDGQISVVPRAYIEIDGVHEAIDRHDAWALAVGVSGVALAILNREQDEQAAASDHAASRRFANPASRDPA